MKHLFPAVAVMATLLLPTLPATAQDDPETKLRAMCVEEGTPESCCDCGYQVLRATFNDREFKAFVEAVELIRQLEQAYAEDNKARIVMIEARMEEIQQVLPEARFNELNKAIDAQCSSQCPD